MADEITVPGAAYNNTAASAATVEGTSYTATAATANAATGTSYDNTAAASNAAPGTSYDNTAAATNALTVLPPELGDPGFFNAGSLVHKSGVDVSRYTIDETSAIVGGLITITLQGDLDPWPGPGDEYWLVTEQGQSFQCDTVDAGSGGAPYTYVFGSLREGGAPVAALILPLPSYDDTAASAKPTEGAIHANDPATPNATSTSAFDPSSPGTVDITAGYDDTPPSAMVLEGAATPTVPITPPTQPQTVTHETTLLADQNYRVMVGSRAAPASINLPNPAGENQWIEVIDASIQADHYPITVDPGTASIDGAAGITILNKPGQVLEIIFGPTGWKIL